MKNRLSLLFLIILVLLSAPATDPVSAGSIIIHQHTISTEDLGAPATHVFDMSFPSLLEPSNGLRFHFFPETLFYDYTQLTMQYYDSEGTLRTATSNQLGNLYMGWDPIHKRQYIGVEWRGPEVERVIVTLMGIQNPVRGGIYTIDASTFGGSGLQDTGSVTMTLGLFSNSMVQQSSNSVAAYSDQLLGQTFTAEHMHKVTSLRLNLYRLGNPGNLTVSIQGTDGSGLPDGNVLWAGSLQENLITTDTGGAWNRIPVPDLGLTAGARYAIVLDAPEGTGEDCAVYWACSTNSYAGGTALRRTAGSWSAVRIGIMSTDFLFEQYGMWPRQLIIANTPGNGGRAVPVTQDWQSAPSTSYGHYPDGTSLLLQASPAVGWRFISWGGDLTGTLNPRWIVMNGDKTVIANYEINTYTLDVTTHGPGTVSRNPDLTHYPHGTTVQLTANPSPGARLVSWEGDCTGTANPVKIVMDGNKNVSAFFSSEPYLDLTWLGLGDVMAKDINSHEFVSGAVAPGTVVQIASYPEAGWHLDRWEGDLSGSDWLVWGLTINNYVQVKAVFVPGDPPLSVGWTEGGGYVWLAPHHDQPFTGGTFPYDTHVTLTAEPHEPAWYFVGWEGDVQQGYEQYCSIYVWMRSRREVFAQFAPDMYPVHVTAANGSVTMDPDQTEYRGGTAVTLTAHPHTGYQFDHWSIYLDTSDGSSYEIPQSTANPYLLDVRWEDELPREGGVTGSFRVIPQFVPLLPVLTVDHPAVYINEGARATNTGTHANVDLAGIAAPPGHFWFWDDGTWRWESSTFVDGPHQRQFTLSATNDHGTSTVNFWVHVNNVAPTLTAPPNQTAETGASTEFDLGSFSDPGINDSPWRIEVDWGEGAGILFAKDVTSQGSITGIHTYAHAGLYPVRVKVTDKDGGVSNETIFTVEVTNTAPVLTAPPNQTACEGTSAEFDLGSFSASMSSGPWTVRVDWGEGAGFTALPAVTSQGALSGLHTYAEDGSYTVKVTVTDKDGGISEEVSFMVTVANVAPSVTAPSVQTVEELVATPIDLGYFTDPGADSPWTVTVNWGDNSQPDVFQVFETGSIGTREHTYGEEWDGTRTVTVSVSDGVATESASFVVTVLEVNTPPVLDPIPPITAPWGTQIEFTAEARDSDVVMGKANTLSYQLIDPPYGARINPETGAFSWLGCPAALLGQPEGGYVIAIRVTDDGEPPLYTEQEVIITWVKRAVTLVYDGDTSGTYSDPTTLAVRTEELFVQLPDQVPEEFVFALGSQIVRALIDSSMGLGIADTVLRLTQAPGSYDVIVSYAGNEIYEPALVTATYNIRPEIATVDYTGPGHIPIAMKASTVTVPLSAIIADHDDGYRGDIRNATVKFFVFEGSTLKRETEWLPVVTVLDADNPVEGVVSGTVTFDAPNDSGIYDIVVLIDNWYYNGLPSYLHCGVLEVSREDLTNFVTGGGHIVEKNAGGSYTPEPGRKIHFGLSLKYNRRGTNIQGNANIIFRRLETVEIAGEVVQEMRVYQIKSNAAYNLFVDLSTGRATYYSKANLTDVTDSELPVELFGNCRLDIWLTDGGKGGANDTIAFALWSSSGELLFSSCWEEGMTCEQLLDGGNISVK